MGIILFVHYEFNSLRGNTALKIVSGNKSIRWQPQLALKIVNDDKSIRWQPRLALPADYPLPVTVTFPGLRC